MNGMNHRTCTTPSCGNCQFAGDNRKTRKLEDCEGMEVTDRTAPAPKFRPAPIVEAEA